jgi:hypothetical protein
MNVRIIILTIACLALAAGMVFADLKTLISDQTYTFTDPQGNNTTLTFTPSTNVTVGINSVAQSYAANSKHLNGDREFGTASDSTAIFWQSSEKGTSLSAEPSSSDASAFSGWNSL